MTAVKRVGQCPTFTPAQVPEGGAHARSLVRIVSRLFVLGGGIHRTPKYNSLVGLWLTAKILASFFLRCG